MLLGQFVGWVLRFTIAFWMFNMQQLKGIDLTNLSIYEKLDQALWINQRWYSKCMHLLGLDLLCLCAIECKM
jgi:hypothetical protein